MANLIGTADTLNNRNGGVISGRDIASLRAAVVSKGGPAANDLLTLYNFVANWTGPVTAPDTGAGGGGAGGGGGE